MREPLAGAWLLEHGHGVLLLTVDGWFSMQVADGEASAGRYGIEGDRFLLDPVISATSGEAGHVQEWRSSFDGDVLVLAGPGGALRWHREAGEVVTGLGTD